MMTVWVRSLLSHDGDTILSVHQTLEGALALHAEEHEEHKDKVSAFGYLRNHAWIIGDEGEWTWETFAHPRGFGFPDYEIRELAVMD